ncbi:gastric inhibitory polypeptide receptor isoform X7 [Mesocricetus auratus]|uniref:Gastric inhibitory polypeptide receptor isoform X7 n=1 Tax=Mesocricetus auratus TaxID=10036 RepID=A0ABM2WHW3_MESAU|nr:gastric inhibitory polypeptide receptor isoform X7 [Mesocricetus auratus]
MPLRPRLLLLCLWGLLLQQAETDSEGQTTGELYQRWERYARECEETLTAADPPSGMVCNGSFDMYVCWDYTAANTTAQASCPWYLPWYRHVAAGYVFRQCGSDGQWGPWRDHTQCENPEKNGAFQDQRLILERLQVVYTVGYSLSLGTLLLALLILSLFRRLHCTRNYIHMNVFLSFMLRAVAILTRDRLLPTLGPYPGDRTLTLRNQALAACRTAQIVTQYCVGANYTWLLVEGVYLHHLLVIVGGSEKGHFRCYLLLGWDQFLHLHPHPWHPCVKTQDAADALPGLPTAGFLVSVLYCFINKEVGEAGLLAPPGGHAGNGAALSAPRCRCSRRSAGAGATASCISASGMSVPVRTRSSAPRPCPRVLHPGRSPSPAAPCPRGRCTGLERRSWKVTARGGANLKSWRTRFQANGIPREDALRTGKMEKGLRASPGDSRGLQMERWAGCGNWASSPGALKISSHFVYDCSARMDVCAPRARRKAFPMPEGQKIPWGWNSVSAARSAAEVSVSSCSTRTDYEGAGCEREARCEECRRLDQEGDHRAVMDLLRDAGRGIKGDCCDKHGDQRALGLGWECTERS